MLTVVFFVAQLLIPRASQGDKLLTNIFSGADHSIDSQLFEHRCGMHSCISGAPVYYGEVFTNTRGGISTKDATRYQALLDLPVAFDFEKMQLPVPGNFFLLAQNTHGNDTMVVIGELEYKYALGTGQFPGTVAVAAAYASDGAISGVPFGSSSGYAVQLEQVIYREGGKGEDNEQGLGIFAAYYPRFADFPIVPKSIGDNFVAGIVYTGLIPQRDWDVVGAGVARAELFQGGTNEETVVELFYKAQLTPRVSLQPDLQYIATPSGIHRDALAVGVRFQLVL